MSKIIISEVLDTEFEACANVIRRSFKTVADDFGLTKENCPTNGAFIQSERLAAEKQRGTLMFALWRIDEIIGFVALEDKSKDSFIMEKLAVLPEYRHLGYGKLLVDFAKDKVRELNGTKISIGIIEENEILKSWYIKNGFTHTGTKIFQHLPFTVGFMEHAEEEEMICRKI